MANHYTSAISSLFGKFASREFSPSLQGIINRSYVSLMGLDMSEFREPSSYPTLNALFTRAFEKQREIDNSSDTMISPADSLVTEFGEIVDGRAYQIKGMEYQIDELFGRDYQDQARLLDGGEFINFYLSPKDYHRYHMPLDLTIKSLTHIPGKLYPVNMPLLRNKKDLFIENERVVIETIDSRGFTHMLVLVGALNVGKMVVTFEEKINTNSHIREPHHYSYDKLQMKKGDLFGWFEMGSTILTFSQKGAITTKVSIDQKVRFGEVVAKLKES
ncbi:Phosphatidylserine decarboxylase [hydrothermal vent metagenome]|uniref:phosphatidylserine decarboxylase n=1 Tax=hydrothermal vent metagenome TaxID=652676 RepID=A0A1W1BDL3_9ZZZZ